MAESDSIDFPTVSAWLRKWHGEMCDRMAALDAGGSFIRDQWQRPEGGGGLSCVRTGGEVFEQLGVNFSAVHGSALPAAALAERPQLAGVSFRAAGVSIVAHPRNPHVPISHANLRVFVTQPVAADEQKSWWFGGGYDLTPCYAYEEDCRHWHRTARDACRPFGTDIYPRLKKWCDDYFRLPHRDNETRGVGGLFFDNWQRGGFAQSFAFLRAVGESYPCAYLPLVGRRHTCEYSEQERSFQLYRRGRYVEFNLLHDRGTRFGLQSGGRTASILMSLPPLVRWQYDYVAQPGSREEQLQCDFLKAREWLDD